MACRQRTVHRARPDGTRVIKCCDQIIRRSLYREIPCSNPNGHHLLRLRRLRGRRAQALLRHVPQRMVPASLTQIRPTFAQIIDRAAPAASPPPPPPRRAGAAPARPSSAAVCNTGSAHASQTLAEDLGWGGTWCVSAAAAAARWRCSSASSSAWMLLSAARSCATTATASPPRPPAKHPSIIPCVSHEIV